MVMRLSTVMVAIAMLLTACGNPTSQPGLATAEDLLQLPRECVQNHNLAALWSFPLGLARLDISTRP